MMWWINRVQLDISLASSETEASYKNIYIYTEIIKLVLLSIFQSTNVKWNCRYVFTFSACQSLADAASDGAVEIAPGNNLSLRFAKRLARSTSRIEGANSPGSGLTIGIEVSYLPLKTEQFKCFNKVRNWNYMDPNAVVLFSLHFRLKVFMKLRQSQ